MDQRFNFVFCKHRNNIEQCYKCEKHCPSVSNLYYRIIRNPITNFIMVIKCKFVKCNQQGSKCSFLYKDKYCLLKDNACYSNRNNIIDN